MFRWAPIAKAFVLLVMPLSALIVALPAVAESAPRAKATRERPWPKRPYPAVLNANGAALAPSMDVTIRLQQRGPYGEVVAIEERRITPKDWGRSVSVGGLSVVAKPLEPWGSDRGSGQGASTLLTLAVKPTGYEVTGPTRPKGTLHYTLKNNSTLHSVVGASPGAVADLIVTFGKSQPSLAQPVF